MRCWLLFVHVPTVIIGPIGWQLWFWSINEQARGPSWKEVMDVCVCKFYANIKPDQLVWLGSEDQQKATATAPLANPRCSRSIRRARCCCCCWCSRSQFVRFVEEPANQMHRSSFGTKDISQSTNEALILPVYSRNGRTRKTIKRRGGESTKLGNWIRNSAASGATTSDPAAAKRRDDTATHRNWWRIDDGLMQPRLGENWKWWNMDAKWK